MLSLFRSHRGKRDQKSHRTPASRKLVLESLEERTMLASTPTLSLIQGNALPLAARGRDTTLPIVSITAPQNNFIVHTTSTSAPLTIKATATDNRSRIANVKFYVDNSTTPIVTDTRSPYSFTWPTQNVSGTHTFKAVAQDGSGKVSTPAVVSVTFVNAAAALTDTSTAPSTQPTATEGLTTSSLTLATFTDANPGNNTAAFTATIHWGDNSTSSGTVSYNSGTYSVTGSHSYANAGSYAVTVDVADVGGSKLTGIGKTIVKVGDAALTDTSTAPSSQPTATVGLTTSSLTLATFTDANPGNNTAAFTATIHWGDNSTSSGTVSYNSGTYSVTGSHSYANGGSYAVTVDVTDVGGNKLTGIGKTTVTVAAALTDTSTAPSTQPTATEGLTTSSLTLATLTDANPGNNTAAFTATIHWGDNSTSSGTVSYNSGTYSVTGSHSYANAGSYAVTVDVADVGGSKLTGIGKAIVKVGDAALTDISTAPSPQPTATEGLTTSSLTLATFTDANPGNNTAAFTATIHWGDNSTSSGTVSYSAGAYSVSGSHIYANGGSYAVAVDVADVGGSKLTGIGKTTVTVAAAALTDTSTTASPSATEGAATASLTLATFTDANPGNNTADFTATIHWGDNSTSSGTVSYNSGTYSVTGSHSYANEGSYAVTVDVADVGGSKLTGIGKTTVTVADAALTDTSTAPSTQPTATEGLTTGSLTLATFTDANPGNNTADFTATIHWGDNSTSNGTVTYSGGTYSVTGSHIYGDEHSAYAVTVDASDVGGSKLLGIGKTTVTVNDAALTDTSTAPSTQPTATEGLTTGSLTLATFTDANPGNNTADFTATIHWGDNSTSNGTVTYSGGTYSVTGSHIYGDEHSAYAVTVDVSDVGGSKLLGIGKTTVTVNDAALTDTSTAPSTQPTATVGLTTSSLTLATFTDANPGNNTADFTATIHWGDNSTSSGTVSYSAGAYSVSGSHIYANGGSYPVTVDVTDVGGNKLTGIGKTTVAVNNAVASPTAIPVISFHGIGTDPANFPYDMPPDTFKADIDALKAAGYHSITLQQYLDWEAGKNPVLPSNPILLTNDDGDATITQMTQVLKDNYNNINYTMVAFIVTGFIDSGDPYYLKWTDIYNSSNPSDPNTLVGSGAWEIAFHAGAYGHYDYADRNDLPSGQPLETTAPYFYPDVRPGETDKQYQDRVTAELVAGTIKLQQMVPTAYTNVFAVPFNDYGEYAPNSPGGQSQKDLTTIFDRFNLVFVEDNDYPNSVYNNHHQYRFEVHNDTSTSALLAALKNEPAFTRFGLPNGVIGTQVVVTIQPPSRVAANTTFGLTVTVEDAAGHVDTTYNGPVLLTLTTSAGADATNALGGTFILDAVRGVATFGNTTPGNTTPGPTINTAGTYTISTYSVDMPGWGQTNSIKVT